MILDSTGVRSKTVIISVNFKCYLANFVEHYVNSG